MKLPTPVNQTDERDWDLNVDLLRLRIWKPTSFAEFDDAQPELLALEDDWGHVYPRERVLLVIERLLGFYNSVTEEQIDRFNTDIQGAEGEKLAARMRLERAAFDNRKTAKSGLPS